MEEKTTPPKPRNYKNPLRFWFYLTLSISLFTFLLSSLSPLFFSSSSENLNLNPLSLPPDLRRHLFHGRFLKAHLRHRPLSLFALDSGPRLPSSPSLLLLPGLASSSFSFRLLSPLLASYSLRSLSLDLPGSSFSDLSFPLPSSPTPLRSLLHVLRQIRDKGLFWGFDQLIETGHLPQIDTPAVLTPWILDPPELASVLRQVIDSLALAPVHLVLHDSALAAGAALAARHPALIASVTLIDPATSAPAMPPWALRLPVVSDAALGVPLAFSALLQHCCLRSVGRAAAEGHRALLKRRDARRVAAAVGRGLNCSFDLGEWAGSKAMRDVPIMVLWAGNWSAEWSEEGRRVAQQLPRAKFVMHSGGRWPQEDAAEEIAEKLVEFVLSLPKPVRMIEEEPLPEHIQKMFDEATDHDHAHDHGGHGHDHHHGLNHAYPAGYMDAYGLGDGWGG